MNASTPDLAAELATAHALLRSGQPQQALLAQRERVRAAPTLASERVFLFQLLAVLGQWQRAGEQLEAAVQLDGTLSLLGSAGQALLRAEKTRSAVFQGQQLPTVLGAPEPWMALLLQALQLEQQGHAEAAGPLRERAFEQAPAVAGSIDGQPFEWLADADARFGPCLEVITPSGYAWLPLLQLDGLVLDAPEDLRDLVWAPAELEWRGGARTRVFIPARYPGTEGCGDGLLQLARRTDWSAAGHGLGQRMLATDHGETALLQVRDVRMAHSA